MFSPDFPLDTDDSESKSGRLKRTLQNGVATAMSRSTPHTVIVSVSNISIQINYSARKSSVV